VKSHPQAAEERGRRGEKAKSAPPSKNDLSREYAVAVGHISWACSEDDLRQLFLQVPPAPPPASQVPDLLPVPSMEGLLGVVPKLNEKYFARAL